MKKTLLVAATVLTLNAAYADTSFKSGAVVGIGLGYSRLSGKVTENVLVSNLPVFAALNSSTKKTGNSDGFVADIFAGYRFKLTNNFLLGFDVSFSKETNILMHSSPIQNGTQTSTTKIRRQFSVIPALTAGYAFNQWMIYGKLGLSISRFELDNISLGAATIATPEKTFTKLGLKETLGVEYALNEKTSVFSEISFEQIRPVKTQLTNPVQGNPAGSTHDVKIKPHYFTAKLGVMFKF